MTWGGALLLLAAAENAAPCVAGAGPDQAQEKAVARLEKLGGKVIRDDNQPGRPVIEVILLNSPVGEGDLACLKDLRHIRSLDLGGNRITDAGLVQLGALKELQELRLSLGVSDARLGHLEELTAIPTCV
jgi:hypothetical protein